MGYCTLDDMKKLLPEAMLINLSSDTPGAQAVNQANIDEAIDQADREIDAHLRLAGYEVPMTPVPPFVTNLSTKMAIWNLHLRKYFDSEVWRDTYKGCLRVLERIAEGRLTLGQENPDIEQPADAGYVGSTRVQKFTSSVMEAFSGFAD